eukprot:COSAG01_NODE_883_length_12927_cov_10.710789_6_plen_80_part_00
MLWHVAAKRYWTAVDQAYWDLSNSSKRSLEVQGGPFTAEEAVEFIGQRVSSLSCPSALVSCQSLCIPSSPLPLLKGERV